MIRIAQIGTGHDHAADIITTLKNQSDIYEVIGFAVVDEDVNNCKEFRYESRAASYNGIKRMTVEEILNCPDLDAVTIETEDRALTKYAIMAAEKGLHIHMDKPGGTDADEFDKLIDLVEEKHLVFQIGYMYRYNSAVTKLKEDIENGKFGEIISVEAQMNCMHGLEKRNWLKAYPGGMLYFLGCHMIDLIYSIMGMPEEIIPLSKSTGTTDTHAEDFGIAAFLYKNGVSFAKSIAVEQGGFERRQLVVCGTKGTAEIHPMEVVCEECKDVFVPVASKVREVVDGNCKNYITEPKGRYDMMMKSFANYINGEKNPFEYEYERELHNVILKACNA